EGVAPAPGPAPLAPVTPDAVPLPTPGPAPAAAEVPAPPASSPAAAPDAPAKSAPPAKAKKPIELWARSVTAYVTRVGPRNELQELVAVGAVHVHQDGAGAEDKPVDIKGETLNLVHYPQGDVLVVFGGARDAAQLQFGEMFLAGPKV